jgi:pimeloyl-ACP methyl ester carboxylesterase
MEPMIAKGTGFPVALIPGVQGRCEWITPTIDALTAGHRVVSWSLGDLRPERENDASFLAWMRAFDTAFDRAHERRLSLVGVSFGGLIAACYAARRPERVTSLILVSTPAPVWHPTMGDRFCVRFPRLALPYFAARALRRLGPEIYRARESWPSRFNLGLEYAVRSVRAPIAPARSAQWIREWQAYDISDECRRIQAPTLLITGRRGSTRSCRLSPRGGICNSSPARRTHAARNGPRGCRHEAGAVRGTCRPVHLRGQRHRAQPAARGGSCPSCVLTSPGPRAGSRRCSTPAPIRRVPRPSSVIRIRNMAAR